MKVQEWQQALECFEGVQRLEPGYRETEALLARVQQHISNRADRVEPRKRQEERIEQPDDLARQGRTDDSTDHTDDRGMPPALVVVLVVAVIVGIVGLILFTLIYFTLMYFSL
jgi:hypothetical protein